MLVELIKTDKTEEYFGYENESMYQIGDIFTVEFADNNVEYEMLDDAEYSYHYADLKEIKKEVNALAELERFQTDRLLHKNKFDLRIATMNIIEELLEAHGIGDNKERDCVVNLYMAFKEYVADLKYNNGKGLSVGITYSEPTVEDQIDAFCDIQVFAGGEIGKLGYSNEQCLIEVGKEINSRTGEIVNSKFEKYKTEEAMAKWYKADFSGCKLSI